MPVPIDETIRLYEIFARPDEIQTSHNNNSYNLNGRNDLYDFRNRDNENSYGSNYYRSNNSHYDSYDFDSNFNNGNIFEDKHYKRKTMSAEERNKIVRDYNIKKIQEQEEELERLKKNAIENKKFSTIRSLEV